MGILTREVAFYPFIWCNDICYRERLGLPWSGINIWKINFFQVREFCGWPGKFKKDLESQGKVRKFENKWLWHAVLEKFMCFVQEGKGCTFSEIV